MIGRSQIEWGNLMKKKWWIVVILLIVLVGVGYAVFRFRQGMSAMQAAMETPAGETAVVERGTLRVTIDASGSLAPNDEVTLAFQSGGLVTEVLVEVGDVVQAGDVLARLDDADAREAVADAELQVAQAEVSLALARIDAELGLAQADIDSAQTSYEAAVALSARTGDRLTSVRVSLEQAQDSLADALEDYNSAWDPARDWELNVRWKKDALESEREATEQALERAQYDLEVAQANYNLEAAGISESDVQSAWTKVLNARSALENEPLQLQQLELSLSQAQLKLDSAQRALEELVLSAPVNGTVTVMNVKAGEMASAGQSAFVLSNLATLVVDINLDETDVAQISVGQEAIVSVDAFPDAQLTGRVIDIAPVAEVQSGVVLYPVTVQLTPTELPVRAGMTTDVEIVTASKENTLIVPLRAVRSGNGQSFVLRQVAGGPVGTQPPGGGGGMGQRPGQTEVTVDASGQPIPFGFEQAEVTLGLMTETEVEIVSGLEEGDVVSVVALAAQDSGGFGPPGMFGGGAR
jgi:HlyD family secretion protein